MSRFYLLSVSLGIWNQVIQQVAKLRDDSSMLKLFTEHLKGEEMYGLTIHAIMRITESVRTIENNILMINPNTHDTYRYFNRKSLQHNLSLL